MWHAQIDELENGRARRFVLFDDQSSLTYSSVIELWRQDADFRSYFSSLLANLPFSAFRWETPPITTKTADRPFEFVVLDSPGLARARDVEAFADHFAKSSSDVVTFPNLGHDAIMVVPCPLDAPSAYGHLAAFVRQAPALQVHSLFAATGDAMASRLNTAPVWLSTAGAGVSWLHVRLDNRPKYYGHEPYRKNPA